MLGESIGLYSSINLLMVFDRVTTLSVRVSTLA
jgi:hypothetical protein